MAITSLPPVSTRALPKSLPWPPNNDPLAQPSPELVIFDLPSSSAHQSEAQVYDVPTQKAPTLERPVLLIHGYNSTAGAWKNMRTWLTREGTNPDGGVVGPGTGPVDPKAKVFLAEFSRPYNGVKSNATELRQAIDKICAATGSNEIDLVGHSMGGLDARYYLDQGSSKVKNLVMIATPDHGSVLADIELKFREMGVPIAPNVDDAEVRQCFQDLREDRMENGKPNNPTVHELNKNWDRQRSRANIMIIAGNGTPTLQSSTLLTMRGDGVVPQKSAKTEKMSDVPIKNIWWTNHSSVKEHPDALIATGNFLTGREVDLREQEPPNVQPDKEIVPLRISADTDQIHYLIQEKKPAHP